MEKTKKSAYVCNDMKIKLALVFCMIFLIGSVSAMHTNYDDLKVMGNIEAINLTVFDLNVTSGNSITLAGATFENAGYYTDVNTNWIIHEDEQPTAFLSVANHNESNFSHANIVMEAGLEGSASTLNFLKNGPSHPYSPNASGIINDGNHGTFVPEDEQISWWTFSSFTKDEYGNIEWLNLSKNMMTLNHTGLLINGSIVADNFIGMGNVTANYYFGDGSELTNFNKTDTSHWTPSGNDVYYTVGNVGIGTISPLSTLHVNGSGAIITGDFDDYLSLTETSLVVETDTDTTYLASHNGTIRQKMEFHAKEYELETGESGNRNYFVMDTDGRIGIGTTTPTERLTIDVNENNLGGLEITNSDTGTTAQVSVILRTIDSQTAFGQDGTYGWLLTARKSNFSSTYLQEDLLLAYRDNITWRNILFVEHDTGNIGIGTTNPIGLLSIDNDEDGFSLLIDHSTSNDSGFILYNSASSEISTVDGLFRVHQQGASATAPAVTIRQDGSGNFLEVSDSAQTSDIFIIDNSGFVGIGTATPQTRLHVQGASDTDNSTLFISTDANAEDETASLQFGIPSRGSSSIIKATSGSAGSSTLIFEIGDTHDSVTERMRIDSDGRVGIGTSNPNALLAMTNDGTVGGSIRINHNMSTSGGIVIYNSASSTSSSPDGLLRTHQIGSTATTAAMTIRQDGAGDYLRVSEDDEVANIFIIANSKEVGIGAFNPGKKLHILSTGDNDVFRVEDTNGWCDINPPSGSLSCTSDIRLKENIVDSGDVLDYLDLIRIREFDLKVDGKHMMGIIAQELNETHPELISENEGDGYLMVQAPDNWVLIKAIQELKSENDVMKISLCSLGAVEWC